MSRSKKDELLTDERIEHLVARALRDQGELIPTSEEEVAAAEAELEEFVLSPAPSFEREHADEVHAQHQGRALPAAKRNRGGLRSIDGSRASRAMGRRSWMGHLVAGSIGALAASVALLWHRPDVPQPLLISAGNEAASAVNQSVPPPTNVVELRLPLECTSCCGGAACEEKRLTCASGRRCVPCVSALQGRYRLRLGAVHLEETNSQPHLTVEQLELCVAVAQSVEECFPATLYGESSEPWRTFARVVSAQDLLSGVRFFVQAKGGEVLGQWQRPVAIGAELLCGGLSVALVGPSGKRIGSVSAFLDDAQYVEVARASDASTLVELSRRLRSDSVPIRVHETNRKGDERFLLAVGPLDAVQANETRWQLLEAGLGAKVSAGGDMVGAPRPTSIEPNSESH